MLHLLYVTTQLINFTMTDDGFIVTVRTYILRQQSLLSLLTVIVTALQTPNVALAFQQA